MVDLEVCKLAIGVPDGNASGLVRVQPRGGGGDAGQLRQVVGEIAQEGPCPPKQLLYPIRIGSSRQRRLGRFRPANCTGARFKVFDTLH
jgi:hypothetical protein